MEVQEDHICRLCTRSVGNVLKRIGTFKARLAVRSDWSSLDLSSQPGAFEITLHADEVRIFSDRVGAFGKCALQLQHLDRLVNGRNGPTLEGDPK